MEDKRILIDTSVVIDHFRKKNKRKSLLYELARESTLFLSAISKFEFLVGAEWMWPWIRKNETSRNGGKCFGTGKGKKTKGHSTKDSC